MKKEEWNEGMNRLDSGLVEEYVVEKDRLSKKGKRKTMWLRVCAAAACLVTAAAVALIPMLRKGETNTGENVPIGEMSTPATEVNTQSGEQEPNEENAFLNAQTVERLLKDHSSRAPTNQYMEIYAPSLDRISITPLPDTETLPVYSFGDSDPSMDDFKAFIDKYADSATSFFGTGSSEYEIKEHEYYKGGTEYSAYIGESIYNDIGFYAHENEFFFAYHSSKGVNINGGTVSVSESDTDDEIMEKLKDTIDVICSTFGFEYTDFRIERTYDEYLPIYLDIHLALYTPEEPEMPINTYGSIWTRPVRSRYISLGFDAGKGEEAILSGIWLHECAEGSEDYYTVEAEEKVLDLAEAEELLRKGYVFGGYGCPLCMAEQPEVDFTDYDLVEIEYVSGITEKISIPFYAFYKYIGDTKSGLGTYAKTYVPAVEVEGINEYFEKKIENHHKK